jgi:hypothetical protein
LNARSTSSIIHLENFIEAGAELDVERLGMAFENC